MADEGALTIEQVAAKTGVSVRNVRYYQELGLIGVPTRQGRTAFYDDRHVERLGRVTALRDEGLSLDGIARLMRPDDPGEHRFLQALLDSAASEAPARTSLDELRDRLPEAVDERVAARALQTAFFRALPDGEIEVRSPTLLRIAGELAELSIPLDDAVELLGTLEEHLSAIAQDYIRLFIDDIWRPALDGDRPVPWAALEQTLVRLRALAGESVAVAFALTMRDTTERARAEENALTP